MQAATAVQATASPHSRINVARDLHFQDITKLDVLHMIPPAVYDTSSTFPTSWHGFIGVDARHDA